MRYDRDAMDRGSKYDRRGGVGVPALLAAYSDSTSSIYARLQIAQNLAGHPDTDTDTKGALLLALAAHADSGTDIYARLELAQLLKAHSDTETSEYARLQIAHLLKVKNTSSVATVWGRNQYDRAGYDRRFSRTTAVQTAGTTTSVCARLQLTNYLAGHSDTDTDKYARLRLDQLLSSHGDTDSSVHGALLLALASYIKTETSVYARLQIGHELKGHVDTDTSEYARLQIASLLKAQADTETSEYARLQIAHNVKGHADTTTDIYALLRMIESWTFTFTGTIAAGATVCIDTNDYTVKNGATNAISGFTGEFPTIFPGTNSVVYTDGEGARTVTITVTKKDRKV